MKPQTVVVCKRIVMVLCFMEMCRNEFLRIFTNFEKLVKFIKFYEFFKTVGHEYSISNYCQGRIQLVGGLGPV